MGAAEQFKIHLGYAIKGFNVEYKLAECYIKVK